MQEVQEERIHSLRIQYQGREAETHYGMTEDEYRKKLEEISRDYKLTRVGTMMLLSRTARGPLHIMDAVPIDSQEKQDP